MRAGPCGRVVLGVILGLGVLLGLRAEPDLPSAEALYRFLGREVPDLPPPSADSISTQEYLRSLDPRVIADNEPGTEGEAVGRVRSYASGIGYLRVNRVGEGLADGMREALAGLIRTQSLNGMVIDLRFAGGTGYAEAGRTAEEVRKSLAPASPDEAASAKPLVILLNNRTREAGEALAVALRKRVVRSLTIGTNSAGRVWHYRVVELPGGDRIRVAGEAVALEDNALVGREGVVPDIRVAVTPEDEALYWEDEFRRVVEGKALPPEATARMNEAELVRRRRLGAEPPLGRGDVPRGAREGRQPAGAEERPVMDPVLARALDILDGLQDMAQRPSQGESR